MASFSSFKSNIITASNTAAGVETSAGVTVYATRSSLPSSGNEAGDQAYVTGNNRLYIWNGSGWYNVALLNVAPSIQSVLDSDSGTTPFSLSSEGATTTITITAVDSDGDPVTYTATSDSDFAGLATLSQADNVFTITPFSQDSATTQSGTITFTATDGVNVASSGVQTFTLNFVSSLWDETVLSIGTSSTNSLDNSTFIDRSTNAHTVTPAGSPVQTAFHPYLDNWSVEFDGAGDGLHFTGSGPADFGTGDFTLEMFVLVHTGEVGYSAMYNSRNSAQGTGAGFFFGLASGSRALMYYYGAVRIVDSNPLEAERWYHVALVRNSGTTTLYKDGVSVGTYSDSTNYTSTEAEIGEDGGFAYDFDGKISNCRIIKGSALYTSNFTPPTEKLTAVTNTTLLTCQSNRFIDNSSSSLTLEVIGTPKVSAFNPFGQGSEYAVGENKGSVLFDTTSYLTAPQIPFGTADFTVEAWHFLNSRAELYPILFSNYNSFSTGAFSLIAGHNSSTTTQYQIAWNGGFPALNAGTIKYNEWVHFAVVRNSGTVTLYINGVSVGSFSGTQTINGLGSAVSISYGGDVPTTTQLDGYISDWTISAGTAKYTANFTPPSTPVGNTNASLYLPMDNAGIFDKTGLNTLTPVGNASTSTTQTKFADTAMYFDGSGDYVVVPYNEALLFRAGDFTVEMWLYKNANNQYMTAAGNLSTANQAAWQIIGTSNGTGLHWYGSNAFQLTSASALSLSTWYHVAFVRSGSTLKLYLNGIEDASTTYSVDLTITNDLYVGHTPELLAGRYWNGYIENFQILKGVAKYTSNFTPPTQEQGRTYQAES